MAIESGSALQRAPFADNRDQHGVSSIKHHEPGCSQYLTYSLGQNGHYAQLHSVNYEQTGTNVSHAAQILQIYTLGQFNIIAGTENISVNSKGQHKPIEMLKALIALGGKDVGEMRLCEALWPDTDGDVAHSAFSVTLHRLRKLIGHDALHLNDSRLTLNPNYCWVDVWQCEQYLNTIQKQFATNSTNEKLTRQCIESIMELYNGPFLGNEDEQAWYLMLRDRMHSKMLRCLLAFSHYLEQNGRCEHALDIYHKGIELDPLAEQFYFRLMKCYATHDRKAEAIAVYLRCANILKTTLAVTPSSNTVTLYKSLLN
jgi:DNA-binding SARP family transcriptional activator